MGRIKNLEEIKAMVRARTGRRNVFRRARKEDVEPVLAELTSKDPELWAAAWARAGARYERQAVGHERAGRGREAAADNLMAYTYYTIGRYPAPHTPGKMACFKKSLELYEKAGRAFAPPLENASIPYGGKVIPAYLRLPQSGGKNPVVINFGGGACAVDMPGVGECPVKGSATAETLFSAVIDYFEKRPEIDPARIAVMGRSFGGYWAAKTAFVESKRLRAAVVWGGGVHYFFQAEWLKKSTHAESYLMDHDVARCAAFGVESLDRLAEIFPSLSLKTQGWLDRPSCPMLAVNGKDDLQTPIEDLYILLEHGAPKSARVFPGGHMGQTPETLPTIIRWLKKELA